MDSHLFKTKSIETLVSDVAHGERAHRRSLSAADLILLGVLTELGVTTEATAKWEELDALTRRVLGVGVTAQTADTLGLQVLGVGAAVVTAGWVLAKVSGSARSPS